MKLLDQKKRKVILNVTPLIDVLFILIIFFTISSTFLEQPGLKLDLPKAASSEPQRVERNVLSVTDDGKIYLNDDEVSRADLAEAIRAAVGESEDKSLIVSADQEARHGLIVEIMDTARQNGVEKLIISAEQPGPSGQ